MAQVSHVVSLAGAHTRTVNAIRFSPDGTSLASGGDGGEIVVWRAEGQMIGTGGSSAAAATTDANDGSRVAIDDEAHGAREEASTVGDAAAWKVALILRGHTDDVQDLSWSPDGTMILSGSVDNTAIVWDAATGKIVKRLTDHKHYVQGVSWDPLGNFLVTQSGDRTCRIYSDQPPTKRKQKGGNDAYYCHHVLHKRDLVVSDAPTADAATAGAGDVPKNVTANGDAEADATTPCARNEADGGCKIDDVDDAAAAREEQENKKPEVSQNAPNATSTQPTVKRHFLFHDETLPTFFRRPSWSPDGSMLATPAGIFQKSTSSAISNTTYVFSRSSFPKPLFQLPRGRPTVAVKFCPIIFRLADDQVAADDTKQSRNRLGLPYKLVWAVATMDSVVFYDSVSSQAFAVVSALHMAAITDIAWAHDASYVMVSSHDGYCSTITFENDELGTPLPASEYPAHLKASLKRAVDAAARGRSSGGNDDAAAPERVGQPPLEELNAQTCAATTTTTTDEKVSTPTAIAPATQPLPPDVPTDIPAVDGTAVEPHHDGPPVAKARRIQPIAVDPSSAPTRLAT